MISKVTKQTWQTFKKAGYAHQIGDQKYILRMCSDGVTRLTPVTIRQTKQKEEPKCHTPR